MAKLIKLPKRYFSRSGTLSLRVPHCQWPNGELRLESTVKFSKAIQEDYEENGQFKAIHRAFRGV